MTDKILWWEHYENKQTKTIHLVASNFTSHERLENYYKYLYGTITFTSEEDFDYIPNFSFVFQIKYIDLWTLSQSLITKVATSSSFQIIGGKLVGTFEWETPALDGLTPYSVASNTSSATPNYVESPSYDGYNKAHIETIVSTLDFHITIITWTFYIIWCRTTCITCNRVWC